METMERKQPRRRRSFTLEFKAEIVGGRAARPRGGPRAAVMLIEYRCLTWRDQDMLGHDLPGGRDNGQQMAVTGAQPHVGADELGGHGVAG